MNMIDAILNRRRLILTVAVILSLSGLVMWFTMTRQEDPRLPDFWGQVITSFPGADAETVERMVLEPIEDAMAEVDEIKIVTATAFHEVAVLEVELRGDTTDFDAAWDEVREALAAAQQDFPAGAGEPLLDEDQQDQDSIVLAIGGSSDLLALLDAARQLKDGLLALPLVSRVDIVADPGEQITVDLDDSVARRLGLSPMQLAHQLQARNRIIPGGSVKIGPKTVRLRPLSEFTSLDEIRDTPLILPSGKTIPLAEVAQVRMGPREPVDARMRFNGEISVGLAIVPRRSINLVDFGEGVRKEVSQASESLEPLTVREVTFQPQRTAVRLSELSRSLLFGMLIVAGVLVTAMGLRLGLVVSAVVPLVTLSSLAIFAWSGGVLHQISIAALVLALGMLVDNAIVVAENVQWRLDQGEPATKAASSAVKELAIPLAGATATTLAAFMPMLISEGPTASFTRTIPILIMLTLTVSYLFALTVTPVLSQMALMPGTSRVADQTQKLGGFLARLALNRPRVVVTAALVIVVVSVVSAKWVDQQFFPSADRNQLVVDLKLAEGTHLDATDQVSRRLEDALMEKKAVKHVAAFIGRSAPHFYYNIQRVPFSPHFAQLIVETRQKKDVDASMAWVRQFAMRHLPGVEVVTRKLEQGPPVGAPVEVRLFGSSFDTLNTSAKLVVRELKLISGTRDVRHDLSPGAPTIRFHINDAVASRYGLTRADLAQALYGRTRGLPFGELYTGEDPIPVVVRSAAGENLSIENLETIDVPTADGRLVPLAQIANLEAVWRPAAIKHRNGQRIVTVSAQLDDGVTFNQVLAKLSPQLATLDIPPSIRVGYGGDAEGAGEANKSLMRSLPIGMILLFGVLLAEFNSFRRIGLILMTVPLAAAGIVPGLLIGNQPFGFMSLLGVFALVGIVVNNAIVMLEVVEDRRRKGSDIESALREAVERRIRPILLTTATTVAGLLPLAFSESTLWPPLAFAMISGLLASTFLTLLVLPAMYRLVFVRSRKKRPLVLRKWFSRATTA